MLPSLSRYGTAEQTGFAAGGTFISVAATAGRGAGRAAGGGDSVEATAGTDVGGGEAGDGGADALAGTGSDVGRDAEAATDADGGSGTEPAEAVERFNKSTPPASAMPVTTTARETPSSAFLRPEPGAVCPQDAIVTTAVGPFVAPLRGGEPLTGGTAIGPLEPSEAFCITRVMRSTDDAALRGASGASACASSATLE